MGEGGMRAYDNGAWRHAVFTMISRVKERQDENIAFLSEHEVHGICAGKLTQGQPLWI